MLIQIGLQGSIEEAYLRRDECSRVSSQRLRTLVRMQDDFLGDLQAANVNNTMFMYRTDSREIDRAYEHQRRRTVAPNRKWTSMI
jgi:hypothetical protein